MSITYPLVERARRRERLLEASEDIFSGLTEPFRLIDYYPTIEYEDEWGSPKTKKEIQPHQRKYHEGISLNGLPAKTIALAGGFGSGKSLTATVDDLRYARTYPGAKILITTAVDWYFQMFVYPIFWSILGDFEDNKHIKRWNAKSQKLDFVNGSEIWFHAFDDPDRIRGFEVHRIRIEEASAMGDGNNEKAIAIYNALLGRLRANNPPYPLQMRMTYNPGGHNWVWKLFIKPEPTAPQPYLDAGKVTVMRDREGNPLLDRQGNPRTYREYEKITAAGDIYYTIATSTNANMYVPAGYVATMLGAYAETPGLRERLVEGLFTPINTLVYEFPIYSEATHVIDYYDFLRYWEITEIPRWWKVIAGIDCGGQRSPWAIVYYVQTEDGHWIGFDEIYVRGLTWGEICDKIIEREEYWQFKHIRYAIDPISSKQSSGPRSETIEVEFNKRGIAVEMPKGYNKHGGIARVQSFLKRNQQIQCPYKAEDCLISDGNDQQHWEIGHAQLYYLKNCPWRQGEQDNPECFGQPGNILEKRVYRYDSEPTMQPKESEEGLSPILSEKIIDRDDHAQTAEMFTFLVNFPLEDRPPRTRSKREPTPPTPLYGAQAQPTRRMGR